MPERPTRLPRPIRKVLRSDVAPERVDAIVRGVGLAAPRRRRWTPIAAAAAAAVAVFALGVVAGRAPGGRAGHPGSSEPVPRTGPRPPSPGPEELGPPRLAEAALPPVLAAPLDREHVFRLSDASLVALSAGARVDVEENSPRRTVLTVTAGRATFDVEPDPRRSWWVRAGEHRVEVVGTRFSVERDSERVRVSVASGVVRVRGPVEDRWLRAGESWRSDDRSDALEAAAPSPVEAPGAVELQRRPARSASRRPAPGASPSARTEPPSPKPAPPSGAVDEDEAPEPSDPVASPRPAPSADSAWATLARQGRYGEAARLLAEAGGYGALHDAADLETLLLAADVARAVADPQAAADLLAAAARRFSHAPAGGVIALARARVLLDDLTAPVEAARVLERALSAPLTSDVEQLVRLRLIEAHGRAGDRTAARRAADAYRQRYPDDEASAMIERWLR